MSDAPAGEPLRPADLIDYQPDGIVSRVLLKQPAGSVTLFAFDVGQELSEHSTPHAARPSITWIMAACGVECSLSSCPASKAKRVTEPVGCFSTTRLTMPSAW